METLVALTEVDEWRELTRQYRRESRRRRYQRKAERARRRKEKLEEVLSAQYLRMERERREREDTNEVRGRGSRRVVMWVEGHTREVAGSAMDQEARPRPSVWSRLGVLGGAATLPAGTLHCSDLFCEQVK